MSFRFLRKPFFTGLCALLTLGLLSTGLSLAAKPTKPGDGGGSSNTGGGTIYFTTGRGESFGLNSMNSDGSGKTDLPLNVTGTPGRALHGGFRWFIDSQAIDGETYPDGETRRELIVIRDDGNEDFTVQLTGDPELQLYRMIWAPGETDDAGLLSGLGRRWIFDGTDWVVDPESVAIYTAVVLFDGQGHVTGLAAPPAPLVPVAVLPEPDPGVWHPDVSGWEFDWSPDLTEVVFSTISTSALLALDVETGTVRTLTTGLGPRSAKWSPAGNQIVFVNSQGSLETIGADGTGRKEIIRWGVSYSYGRPAFSPTGSHIVYERIPHGSLETDLFRATSSGGSKSNLTNGIPGFETARGWR